MKPENMQTIQQAFTQQSMQFESSNMNFTNKDYLAYTVSRITPAPPTMCWRWRQGSVSADGRWPRWWEP